MLLIDLQAQDRVTVMAPGHGCHRNDEQMYFVEWYDAGADRVHLLTHSMARRSVAFSDLVDVQKTLDPIEILVQPGREALGRLEPNDFDRPVRAVGLQLDRYKRLSGLVLPRKPGQGAGNCFTVPLRESGVSLEEKELVRRLPVFGGGRSRSVDEQHSREARTAAGRVQKYLREAVGGGSQVLPVDPSLRATKGFLMPS